MLKLTLYVGGDPTSTHVASRLQRIFAEVASQLEWNICDVAKTELTAPEDRYVTVLPCLVRWNPEPVQEWIVHRIRFRSLVELVQVAGVAFPFHQREAFLTFVGESETKS